MSNSQLWQGGREEAALRQIGELALRKASVLHAQSPAAKGAPRARHRGMRQRGLCGCCSTPRAAPGPCRAGTEQEHPEKSLLGCRAGEKQVFVLHPPPAPPLLLLHSQASCTPAFPYSMLCSLLLLFAIPISSPSLPPGSGGSWWGGRKRRRKQIHPALGRSALARLLCGGGRSAWIHGKEQGALLGWRKAQAPRYFPVQLLLCGF